MEKIKQFGFFRSFHIFLTYMIFTRIRYFYYKFLYKFDLFGKNIKIFSSVEFDNPSVSIGNNVIIGKNVRFGNVGRIIIGDNTGIGAYSSIESIREINIGKNCQIAKDCYFIDHDHFSKDTKKLMTEQTDFDADFSTSKPIIVEDNCWLGTKVIVLKGVTIGSGSIIGAGSVVTKNIPRDSVAVGVPAKVIKRR